MRRRQGRVGWLVALTGVVLAGSLILAGCGATSTTGTAQAPTATVSATDTATATDIPSPTPPHTPTPRPTATRVPQPTPTRTPAPTTVHVSIVNLSGTNPYGFSPSTITITRGSTVIWTNKTSAPHSASSDAGDPVSFDSGSQLYNQNSTYSFTFTVPGTYYFHCNVHPTFMKGTIIVTG